MLTFEQREHLNDIFEITSELALRKGELETLEREAESEEWGKAALEEDGPLVVGEIQFLLAQLRSKLENVS